MVAPGLSWELNGVCLVFLIRWAVLYPFYGLVMPRYGLEACRNKNSSNAELDQKVVGSPLWSVHDSLSKEILEDNLLANSTIC